MHYKLIISTVMIGVVSGITTIYWVHADYELFIWLTLIICLGALTAKNYKRQVFIKGMLLACITGISITCTHLFFVDDYIAVHISELLLLEKIKIADSYRLTLLIIAPIYWFVFGLFTGLSAIIWNKYGPNRT